MLGDRQGQKCSAPQGTDGKDMVSLLHMVPVTQKKILNIKDLFVYPPQITGLDSTLGLPWEKKTTLLSRKYYDISFDITLLNNYEVGGTHSKWGFGGAG